MLRTNLSKKFQKTTISEGANSTKNPQNATKTQEKRENSKKLDYSNNPINVAKTPVLTTKQSIDNKDNSLIYHTQNGNVKFSHSYKNRVKSVRKNTYQDWKDNFESAISRDYDYSEQWNYIGIDTTTKSRKQFGNDNTSLFKNRKGRYKAKVHNSTEYPLSPYNYATEYLGYSDTFQNFICEVYNLPKYDDVFGSYTNTTKTKKVPKKPFKPLKKESKRERKIIAFEVRRASEFDTNVTDYLSEKANISTLHFGENGIFQIERASKTYDNGYTSVMKSDLLFGVRLEGSECYKVIDKANKKFNWFPTLDYARNNGLLAKDYSYSLGIDTFVSTQDYAYLVGGEMDFLALKENGLDNVFTVGNETSSISEYVLRKIKNKGIKTVFVVYDTDFTGVRNSVKLHDTAKDGIVFKRVELPQLKRQSFRYNKRKEVFEYAYSDSLYKQIPNNSETLKPTHNDICDYIGKYGFDGILKEVLTNYSEPTTPPKPQYEYNYTLYIERFLGSALLENKTVFDAITTEKTVLVKSDTGTGKSTSALELAKFFSGFLDKKIIYAAPRISIATQQAVQNDKLLFVGNTFDDSTDRFLGDLQNNDILYCNNDNLERLTEFLKLKSIDFYTIIDEPHLLPSDASYRKSVVKSVFRVIENNNTLLLTATPKELHFNTFKINVVATKKAAYQNSNVYVGSGKKAIQKAIDIIVNGVEKGRNALLLLNSMKSIRKIQLTLEKYGIESYVFASKELTDSEQIEYDNFLKRGTFTFEKNAKKRVVLGTCSIATGVNFVSENAIDTINFNQQNGFNGTENYQFKARIRNYESIQVHNHIITPSLNQKEVVEKFDFQKVVQRAQIYCDCFNSQYKLETEKYEKSRIKLECSNLCFFNEATQLFEVDYIEIQLLYEKHLIDNYSVLSDNPISVQHIDTDTTEETEAACKTVNEIERSIENTISELYKNDFKALCKAVHSQTKDREFLQPKTFREIRNEQIDTEIVLDSSELVAAEKLLKKHFTLIKIAKIQKVQETLIAKNDKTGLLEFTKPNTYYKLRKNLEINFLLSIPKPSIEEKDERKLLESRINKIVKYASKPITLKELHDKVNKRVSLEHKIKEPYLLVLLDRFFEVEKHRESRRKPTRKTYLIASRK